VTRKIRHRVQVKVKPLRHLSKAGPQSFEDAPKQGAIYGLHQPYDQGYSARHRDINPREYKASRNARFVNQIGQDIWFWVDDFEADFEITGSTAQSRRTRQFYPHNMAQPSVVISGVAPSNLFYNELANFVRAAQYYSVTRAAADPTMTFYMYTRHQHNAPARRRHLGWTLKGYVKNMRAGGEKEKFAYPFQFEFIIASVETHGGNTLFDDDLVTGRKILSWMDVFKSAGSKGWVKDPTPAPQSQKNNENDFNTAINDLPDGRGHGTAL
jgi:hypothetical protein